MIQIRSGRPDERAALEELQRRASLAYEEYRPYLLANPEAIELPLAQLQDNRVRVAQIAGRLVGFSAVLAPRRAEGTDICDLDGLFVEPGCWGRGIGRRLVEDALAACRAAGVAAMDVIANPRAGGFYEKLGFAITGTARTQFGPANRMRRLAIPRQS